jgi:hypothetical protein
MARVRPLYPGQWSDDEFVPLTFGARLLCLGLRNFSDDNGIVEWNPLKLKMNIFPADNLDVIPLMTELLEHHHVFRYEIEGKFYGLIRNFHKWNRPDRPGYYHPLPQDGDVPEIALRRLVIPSATDRRQVGDKSATDRRQVGDISGNGGGGGGGGGIGDGVRGGGHARASVGDQSETSRRSVGEPPAAAASFSKSKKNSPRRSAAAQSSPPDPIPFKNFPPISHEQIKTWAVQFEGSQKNIAAGLSQRDACNKIWEHLNDLDRKFSLGKSKGGMDKPIGDPIKNLHALLRKRYGR